MSQLLFIPGSLRAASSSRAVVRALIARVEAEAVCITADTGRLPLYNADVTADPEVSAFIAQIRHADGLVFVTPEYNYSLPGVLKNAIDWASRPALNSVFKDKPCFVMSVSGGMLGGVRALAHLKYILNGVLAQVFVCPEIVVPMANDKIVDGEFADETTIAFAEEKLRVFLSRLG
jgi:chromate reductase